MTTRRHRGFHYFFSSFAVVLGVVLIWRALWYALDWADQAFFGGSHWFTVIGSVIVGFLILYLPDRDLSELRKL